MAYAVLDLDKDLTALLLTFLFLGMCPGCPCLLLPSFMSILPSHTFLWVH